jgi:hypothetical protein
MLCEKAHVPLSDKWRIEAPICHTLFFIFLSGFIAKIPLYFLSLEHLKLEKNTGKKKEKISERSVVSFQGGDS